MLMDSCEVNQTKGQQQQERFMVDLTVSSVKDISKTIRLVLITEKHVNILFLYP